MYDLENDPQHLKNPFFIFIFFLLFTVGRDEYFSGVK